MDSLKGRSDFSELGGDKYDACHVCGPLSYRAVVHFDGALATPIVGETITGTSPAGTGKVESVTMTSATAGVMVLSSPTGYDDISLNIFVDNQALTGDSGGAGFVTANGQPSVQKSGRLYPDTMLIEYQGIKYCRDHFAFMFKQVWLDEQVMDTDEPERGK